jgi:hypothetical protein
MRQNSTTVMVLRDRSPSIVQEHRSLSCFVPRTRGESHDGGEFGYLPNEGLYSAGACHLFGAKRLAQVLQNFFLKGSTCMYSLMCGELGD